MEDQRPKTLEHIEIVRKQIQKICEELYYRGRVHDSSKLERPEREIFDEYTPKLRDTTYGSEEYKHFLSEMKPALDHHYAVNRHHPEHFKKWVCNGCFEEFTKEPDRCHVCGYSQFQEEVDISRMNLVDIVEMFCDWKAATLRHTDGDLQNSITINQKRFHICNMLTSIFRNSVELFEEPEIQ